MPEQTKIEWIAAKIKHLRMQRGYTQRQLAERVGLGFPGRVRDYEQIRNVPQMVKFLELIDALGVSPAEFLATNAAPSIEE